MKIINILVLTASLICSSFSFASDKTASSTGKGLSALLSIGSSNSVKRTSSTGKGLSALLSIGSSNSVKRTSSTGKGLSALLSIGYSNSVKRTSGERKGLSALGASNSRSAVRERKSSSEGINRRSGVKKKRNKSRLEASKNVVKQCHELLDDSFKRREALMKRYFKANDSEKAKLLQEIKLLSGESDKILQKYSEFSKQERQQEEERHKKAMAKLEKLKLKNEEKHKKAMAKLKK